MTREERCEEHFLLFTTMLTFSTHLFA